MEPLFESMYFLVNMGMFQQSLSEFTQKVKDQMFL